MKRHNRILTELKELAKQIFANLPASAYLYGSRACGEAHKYSDWDIIIVTDDSVDKNIAFEELAYPFTKMGWKLGEQITPLIYTRSEWYAERNTAFHRLVCAC